MSWNSVWFNEDSGFKLCVVFHNFLSLISFYFLFTAAFWFPLQNISTARALSLPHWVSGSAFSGQMPIALSRACSRTALSVCVRYLKCLVSDLFSSLLNLSLIKWCGSFFQTQKSQKITSAFLSTLTSSLMFHFHTSVSDFQASIISSTAGHPCMTKLKITQKRDCSTLGHFQKWSYHSAVILCGFVVCICCHISCSFTWLLNHRIIERPELERTLKTI